MSGRPRTPPARQSSSTCYRITNIPSSWDEPLVRATLCQLDPVVFSMSDGNPVDIGLFPSVFGNSLTALVTTLQKLDNLVESRSFQVPDPTKGGAAVADLTIDLGFYGLTPLNTPVRKTVVDLVCVTGLAGHAYGSWRHNETRRHWLRDFIPEYKPELRMRIMTYGYDTKLKGMSNRTEGIGIMDHARDFLDQLTIARNNVQDRPIIFIAHSMGGILVKTSLMESKQARKNIHKVTRAILFFGTPHRGLSKEALTQLKMMLEDQPAGHKPMVLEELGEFSSLIQDQSQKVPPLIEKLGVRILSVCELELTPSIVKCGNDYQRTGPGIMMVSRNSAFMGLPEEIRLSHRADHSKLVKFPTMEDTRYLAVVRHIQGFMDWIISEKGDVTSYESEASNRRRSISEVAPQAYPSPDDVPPRGRSRDRIPSSRSKTRMSLESLRYVTSDRSVISETGGSSYDEISNPYAPPPKPKTRLFECVSCMKRFVREEDRLHHQCSHTKGRHFGCPECHRNFFQKEDLRHHQRKAHRHERSDAINVTVNGTRSSRSPAEDSTNTSILPLLMNDTPGYSWEYKKTTTETYTHPDGTVVRKETVEYASSASAASLESSRERSPPRGSKHRPQKGRNYSKSRTKSSFASDNEYSPTGAHYYFPDEDDIITYEYHPSGRRKTGKPSNSASGKSSNASSRDRSSRRGSMQSSLRGSDYGGSPTRRKSRCSGPSYKLERSPQRHDSKMGHREVEGGPNGNQQGDLYSVLGVPHDASPATIRSNYKKTMIQCHPDKASDLDEAERGKRTEKFYAAQKAYEVLSDRRRREAYDYLMGLKKKPEKPILKQWESRKDAVVSDSDSKGGEEKGSTRRKTQRTRATVRESEERGKEKSSSAKQARKKQDQDMSRHKRDGRRPQRNERPAKEREERSQSGCRNQ